MDLPSDIAAIESGELREIERAWTEQRATMEKSGARQRFIDRMVRSWCIETGIIERIFTLDRGVTQTLVEQGLHAALIPHGKSDLPAEELIAILEDHKEAADGLFTFVAGRRSLSKAYVLELH
ncbi:MAG: hypothetical protein EXS13_14535 [Planctomycetes bacterium]|nr:hypothetical protein [Planctomycetota bacterium]